jgi:L-alanine-DL-glutamate epimerase-like enolase superfamily enzyme
VALVRVTTDDGLQGWAEDHYPRQSDLFTTGILAHDGCVQIPEGPGWGVDINPKSLATAKYRKSEL